MAFDTDKKINYIDLNLYSGSLDTIRFAMGAYYHLSASDEYGGNFSVYNGAGLESDLLDTGPSQEEFSGVTAYYCDTNHNISYTQMNTDLVVTSSKDLSFKSIKVPVRFIGDPSNISNDQQWRKIILGGIYGSSSYMPIYTEGTFDDHTFSYVMPYSLKEKFGCSCTQHIVIQQL